MIWEMKSHHKFFTLMCPEFDKEHLVRLTATEMAIILLALPHSVSYLESDHVGWTGTKHKVTFSLFINFTKTFGNYFHGWLIHHRLRLPDDTQVLWIELRESGMADIDILDYLVALGIVKDLTGAPRHARERLESTTPLSFALSNYVPPLELEGRISLK